MMVQDPTLADALDLAARFADPARGAHMLLYVDKVVLILAEQVRRYQAAEQAMTDKFDLLNADTVNIANPNDADAVAHFDAVANGAAAVFHAFKRALEGE